MRKNDQGSKRVLSRLPNKLQPLATDFTDFLSKGLTLLADNINKAIRVLPTFMPLFAFIVPFMILFSLYGYTFEQMYQGRTFYLFFLWLVTLEVILGYENLRHPKINKIRSWRAAIYVGLWLLPTAYVGVANFAGLNQILMRLALSANVGEHWSSLIPLTVEFLVFTVLFASTVLLQFGVGGLKNFTTSILFLGIMGGIFAIDNLYPNGRFTPFQSLVQPTATLSADVFRFMGFQTSMTTYYSAEIGSMPVLGISSLGKSTTFGIAWPCAGIESLLIYTVTMALFLGYSSMKRIHKILFFVIGAIVTYSLNIARIVWIFLIDFNGGDYQPFHALYGPLISVTWIVCYPLIIMGIQMLSTKTRT